jgi:hypothetical protein
MGQGREPELRLYEDELIVAPRDNGRFVPGVHYSPETQIKPGERISIATEFKAGERRGPATEFRKGQQARNKLPVGSVTERRDKNGRIRAWIKVAEPNVWVFRAVVVWESEHGPLPRGKVVHHRDRNSLNDAPDNLVALTRAEHIAEHQIELATAAVQAAKARAA